MPDAISPEMKCVECVVQYPHYFLLYFFPYAINLKKGIYTLNDRNGNVKCVIRILNVKDENHFILKWSLFVCMYVYVYMHLCMHLCMRACMRACACVYIHSKLNFQSSLTIHPSTQPHKNNKQTNKHNR